MPDIDRTARGVSAPDAAVATTDASRDVSEVWPGVTEPAALLSEVASWLHGYGNRGTRLTYASGLGLPTTVPDVREWVANAPGARAHGGRAGAESAVAWRAALTAYLAALDLTPTSQPFSRADASSSPAARKTTATTASGTPAGATGRGSSTDGVAAGMTDGGTAGETGSGARGGRRTPPPAPRGRLRALHWFRWCAARGLDPVRATSTDVKTWLDALDEAGAAPATRDRMLGSVKAMYAHLADAGLTDGNPAALDRRRLGLTDNGSASRTVTLTAEQVRVLHDEAGRVRQGVGPLAAARAQAVVALLTLGLRVSELVGLDRGDVTVTRGRTALRVLGKGGRTRVVYVSRLAGTALVTYLSHRDGREPAGAAVAVTSAAHARSRAAEPLVATADGTRLTRQGVWHLLRRVAIAAGEPLADVAPLLHPHALRHFYVTAAVEAGAQLVHVQADVGHTSADTTEQVYNAAARDPSRSAVDLVADAIEGLSTAR